LVDPFLSTEVGGSGVNDQQFRSAAVDAQKIVLTPINLK
jgi:hypothetical protein